MLEESNISVRPMLDDEEKLVHDVHKRCFSRIEHLFYSLTPHVLVARYNDQLVGGIILKVFSLRRKRKIGLVHWVFTTPEVHGLGLGQKLIEAALEYLKEQGCDEILAQIRGTNSSSFKLFSTRDFSIISPNEQLRRWGMGFIKVWSKTTHFLAFGHFLWGYPSQKKLITPLCSGG